MMFKKMMAAVLAAFMILGSVVPTYAAEGAEEIVEAAPEAEQVGGLSASGYCGDNATYTWNASTGKLVISGKGSLYGISDYIKNGKTIFKGNKEIKSIVINEGIQVIGDATFMSLKNLRTVVIPRTCVSVKQHAFNNDFNLDLYYNGTREEFWNINVEMSNQGWINAKLHFKKGKEHQFKDVTDRTKYYYNAVSWAGTKGVTSGIGDGTNFGPKVTCTRAMIVMLLYKMAGSPKTNAACPFTDVKKGDWYYNGVRWAVEKGITHGYGEGTFQPNALCTRAMIVSFIHNYDGGRYDTFYWSFYHKQFPDVTKGDWFYYSVYWGLYEKQFVSGKDDGKFHPNVPCTRGEAVTFLYKYMNEGSMTGTFDQIAEFWPVP